MQRDAEGTTLHPSSQCCMSMSYSMAPIWPASGVVRGGAAWHAMEWQLPATHSRGGQQWGKMEVVTRTLSLQDGS